MEIVADFTAFKAQLREKWLDYCEANEESLNNWYGTSTYLNDNFILGVLTVIEPKVIEWTTFYFTHIESRIIIRNSIDEKFINFLGLYFDYKEALETRKEERAKNSLIELPSPLDEFRET